MVGAVNHRQIVIVTQSKICFGEERQRERNIQKGVRGRHMGRKLGSGEGQKRIIMQTPTAHRPTVSIC